MFAFEYSWNVTYRDNELSNSSTVRGVCFFILFFLSIFFSSDDKLNVRAFFFFFYFRSCHPCKMKETNKKNYWIFSFPLQQRKFTIQISVFRRTRKSNKIHVHISSTASSFFHGAIPTGWTKPFKWNPYYVSKYKLLKRINNHPKIKQKK